MPLPKNKVRVEELIGRSGRRSFHIKANKDNIDIEKRTIKNLSISSETSEVVRYDWLEGRYYREVLLHGAENVDLSRLEAGANLFLDHDYKTENAIAVIEGSRLDSGEKKVRIDTRFSKKEKAQVTLDDIDDGILGNVSMGYEILEAREAEGEDAEGVATIEITRWQPFEASIVGIPADTNVGIGRSKEVIKEPKKIKVEERVMPEPIIDPVKTAPPVDIDAIKRAAAKEARTEEQERTRELEGIADANPENKDVRALVRKHCKEGTPLDKAMHDIMINGFKAREADPKTENDNLDLSPKDVKSYSVARMLLDIADGNFDKSGFNSFELECSKAVEKKSKRSALGICIPMDIRNSNVAMTDAQFKEYSARKYAMMASGQRDLNATTDSAGGYLVGTDYLGSSFIELFTNALKVFSLGVRMLPGLVGDVAIANKLTTGVAYWVAEGVDITQSDMTFGTKSLTPKTVGALTEFTRQLLLQANPAIEQLVREDLALVLAQAIDLAVLLGSGSAGQPTGIANTTGINTVALGTNGAVPTRTSMVNMETEIANDNALISDPIYLTNSKVRGKLKLTDSGTDTGVWVWGGPTGNNLVNGYRAEVSNQVPSNLTKGTGSDLSAIYLGIWNQCMLGMWGGFDILRDPYTNSANGTIRYTALQSVDVLVRQPTAFCYINDAITV